MGVQFELLTRRRRRRQIDRHDLAIAIGTIVPRTAYCSPTGAIIMMDRNTSTEAEGALQNAADKVKDAARGMADNVATASSAAYDEGSELVAKAPGSALLLAGIVGFAL